MHSHLLLVTSLGPSALLDRLGPVPLLVVQAYALTIENVKVEALRGHSHSQLLVGLAPATRTTSWSKAVLH